MKRPYGETRDSVLALKAAEPDITSKEIAYRLGLNWGYVRKTLQGRGYSFTAMMPFPAFSGPPMSMERISVLRQGAAGDVTEKPPNGHMIAVAPNWRKLGDVVKEMLAKRPGHGAE